MKTFKIDSISIIQPQIIQQALSSDTLTDFYKVLTHINNIPVVAPGVLDDKKFKFKIEKRHRDVFLPEGLKIPEGIDENDLEFKNLDTGVIYPVTARFLCFAQGDTLLPYVDILHSKQQNTTYRRLLNYLSKSKREPVASCIAKLLSLDECYVLSTLDGDVERVQQFRVSQKCLPIIAEMLLKDLFARTQEQIEWIKQEMVVIGFIPNVMSESDWDNGIEAYKKIATPYLHPIKGYVDESRYEILERELTRDATWMEYFRNLLQHIFQRIIETITFSKYEENKHNYYKTREAFKYLYKRIKDEINERVIAKDGEHGLSEMEETQRSTQFWEKKIKQLSRGDEVHPDVSLQGQQGQQLNPEMLEMLKRAAELEEFLKSKISQSSPAQAASAAVSQRLEVHNDDEGDSDALRDMFQGFQAIAEKMQKARQSANGFETRHSKSFKALIEEAKFETIQGNGQGAGI